MHNEIVLVLGRKGSGKSSLVKNVLIKERDRLIIVDSLSEYNDFLVIEDFESLVEYCSENKTFQIACQFTSKIDIEYLFEYIFIEGNLTVCCEEISKYISSYERDTSFTKLIDFGRHKNIDIIAIARRPSELSRTFRAQIDTLYTFKQIDKVDIDIMAQMGVYGVESLEMFDYDKFKGIPKESIHFKISQF